MRTLHRKKLFRYPVPSRDVTYQTLPGRELWRISANFMINPQIRKIWPTLSENSPESSLSKWFFLFVQIWMSAFYAMFVRRIVCIFGISIHLRKVHRFKKLFKHANFRICDVRNSRYLLNWDMESIEHKSHFRNQFRKRHHCSRILEQENVKMSQIFCLSSMLYTIYGRDT
jgi:hypothetical protein